MSVCTGMTGPPVYAVVDSGGRHIQSGNVAYECLGSESRLVDCVVPLAATETPCYYALVQCNNTGTPHTETDTSASTTTSTTVHGTPSRATFSSYCLLAVYFLPTIQQIR